MMGRGKDGRLIEALGAFGAVRPRLFGIAYRMLGSVAEAEDVVQEAWLRWQQTDRSQVRDPIGYLVTTTSRLALNAATSARARRELYPGPWLPEPVDTSADPTLQAERNESLELAVLLLLERLTPAERAVYVLRSVRLPIPADRRGTRRQRGVRTTARPPRPHAPGPAAARTGRPRRPRPPAACLSRRSPLR